MAEKIVVLASGGDAPGMNACVKAVFEKGRALGFEVWAAVDGLNGLIDEDYVKLTEENTKGISGVSGCVFKCGRSPRFNETAYCEKTIANIRKAKFAGVIIIGGNGSQVAAGRLKKAGIPLAFIPGTVDNDVPYTRYAVGFSSASESAVRDVDALCATFETIKRDHIVQLMGRGCTELASVLGAATFADIVDMEGQRHTPEQVANIFKANRAKGKTSSFMIMQERKEPDEVAMMMNSAKYLGDVMKFTGDKTIRMTTLGFLQRGAFPSCRDRWLAVLYANKACELIKEKKFGLGVCTINDEIQTYEIKLADI